MEELGMASTFEHQKIIQNIFINLVKNGYTKEYEVFLNSCIDKKDLYAQTTDIEIFINKEKNPQIVIEIEHNQNINRIHEKQHSFLKLYNIKEFFVYLYDKKEWRKYTNIDKMGYENKSYSSILKCDFSDFLDNV